MNRRISFTLAAVALAVIAATSPANATCSAPQAFISGLGDTGNNNAVVFAPNMSQDPSVLIGRFWDGANFNNINNGPAGSLCPPSNWLDDWAAPFGDPNLYILGFMGAGTCDNVGACIAGTNANPNSMTFVLETLTTDGSGAAFWAGRVKNTFEITGGGGNAQDSSSDFDFSRTAGNLTLIPVPRPRSVRTAANTFTVTYDSSAPGIQLNDGFTGPDSLVSYKLLTAISPTDPGRNPSAWTVIPAIRTDANNGGQVTLNSVPVDCGTQPLVPHWIAVQVNFEGGSAPDVAGSYVGAATQINCDPTLANPRKPKQVGKKLTE